MDIKITKAIENEQALTVKASGKIDLDTAVNFGTTITDAIEDNDATDVTLDFSEITYISSIGLRVILELHKKMQELGKLRITGANQEVLNIFNMTGFSKFLNIE